MKTLYISSYFAPVTHWIPMANGDEIMWENHDHYQKQTYRNRMYIYGANGPLMLSIPIKHLGKEGHQKTNAVKIENAFPWQQQHWKSIETAYRASPFFEFYEDQIKPLYNQQFEKLFDFNLACFRVATKLLGFEDTLGFTSHYEKTIQKFNDQRSLINAKSIAGTTHTPYYQQFENKHGFISNLSILDLIFHEGTNAVNCLQKIA